MKLAPSLAQLQEQQQQAPVVATPQPPPLAAAAAATAPRAAPASSGSAAPAFSPFGQSPAITEQHSIFSSKKGPGAAVSSSTSSNKASAQLSQVKTMSKMVLFVKPGNKLKISQLITQSNWIHLMVAGGGGFEDFSWAPNPHNKIIQVIKDLGLEDFWPKVIDDLGNLHFSYGVSYRKGTNKWAGGVETMYHPGLSGAEGPAMCTFSPPTTASFAQLSAPVCVIIEPLWATAYEKDVEASNAPTFSNAKAALAGKGNNSRKRSHSQVDLTSAAEEEEEEKVSSDRESESAARARAASRSAPASAPASASRSASASASAKGKGKGKGKGTETGTAKGKGKGKGKGKK